MNVLINLIIVIISPGRQISNHHVAQFKYAQFYLSIKMGKEKRKRGMEEGKDKKWERNSMGRLDFVPPLLVALHYARVLP